MLQWTDSQHHPFHTYVHGHSIEYDENLLPRTPLPHVQYSCGPLTDTTAAWREVYQSSSVQQRGMTFLSLI